MPLNTKAADRELAARQIEERQAELTQARAELDTLIDTRNNALQKRTRLARERWQLKEGKLLQARRRYLNSRIPEDLKTAERIEREELQPIEREYSAADHDYQTANRRLQRQKVRVEHLQDSIRNLERMVG